MRTFIGTADSLQSLITLILLFYMPWHNGRPDATLRPCIAKRNLHRTL